MKYLSLGLIVLAMWWTWDLSSHRDEVSEAVHVEIQDDLKQLITDYIQKNLPQSKNLRFEKMWSEKVKENQVKASFVYSFEDENEEVGAARVEIEGYAILNRDLKPNEKEDIWTFDELNILNNHIVFKDGITVKPASDGDED